jgi:hypothetical protein
MVIVTVDKRESGRVEKGESRDPTDESGTRKAVKGSARNDGGCRFDCAVGE